MTTRRIISNDPFIDQNGGKRWLEQGLWPCRWVGCNDAGDPPFVTAYRLSFSLDQAASMPIHVSADERYELFLDGERVGRGPERSDPNHWHYETYQLDLSAGAHVLAARVWSLGPQAPLAQMSVRPGFLLCAEAPWRSLLGTGVAAWQAKKLPGYSFAVPPETYWRGARITVEGGDYAWDFERGSGEGWGEAKRLGPGVGRVVDFAWHNIHRLQPASLPPLLEIERRVGNVRHVAGFEGAEPDLVPLLDQHHLPNEQPAWQALLHGMGEVTIPPHTRRRVLFDLEDYYCLYPALELSGGAGALLRLHSAESLYNRPDVLSRDKGHRDEIGGKYFRGVGDTFLPDGGQQRTFETLWWQAGRYWQLVVTTADEALTIHNLRMTESRYPLEMESEFAASDASLGAIQPMLVRSMQMCSHETYYDAPYYEELMYAGDARLEMLTTYVMSRDDRLPRKSIELFDSSRLSSGLTQARYPCSETQVIPPFALWWTAMLHDYAYWRDDAGLVRRLLPGMRATLESFQRYLDDDGFLVGPEGWNFMDWLPEWDTGIPPTAADGRSGVFNWQLVYAFSLAADLESQLGEPEYASLWQRRARELAQRALAIFWDEERGLLAETTSGQIFSEHTQAMALLSGQLPEPHRTRVTSGLLHDPDLLRATYYFSHYLFEAYHALGSGDALLSRLRQWRSLLDFGLKTTPEKPEPTRSDCHAWSAHPLFHYFATILGIRPASPGFRTVEIRPQLGDLAWAKGSLVHPRGEILVDFEMAAEKLHGIISLPPGISGRAFVNGRVQPLRPGQNVVGTGLD